MRSSVRPTPALAIVLSIGEHDVQVTLPIVAGFLRAIGGGTKLLRPETRQRLQAAMRAAVERSTARSGGARLADSPWRLGGKTGTGPAGNGAPRRLVRGLIFDPGGARYTIAVYIERRGPGGGVAAAIAADVTRTISSWQSDSQ